MATPKDKCYTELYSTITDCYDRNSLPFTNEKVQYAIHRVVVEEEVDAHNITLDTFSQTPVTLNTQVENENTIFASEKRNNLYALAEKLKGLTINNAGYYESDSENANERFYPGIRLILLLTCQDRVFILSLVYWA